MRDDFVELRKEGLQHPLMDEIVAAFDKTNGAPRSGLVEDQAAP